MQTDNIGFGGEKRRQSNKGVLEGKETFRYPNIYLPTKYWTLM